MEERNCSSARWQRLQLEPRFKGVSDCECVAAGDKGCTGIGVQTMGEALAQSQDSTAGSGARF
jgi:hypothetical protein